MRKTNLEVLTNRILVIRGQRVMLDADLAAVYGVPTKRLNEQVRRNRARFPSDFMFRLSESEKNEVVAKCDHLQTLKFSPVRPCAFTEHGALMLANVLNSSRAVQASLVVVRALLRFRSMLLTNYELSKRLDDLEKCYDAQFKVVFAAIREIMDPPAFLMKRIGFQPPDAKG